MNLFKKVDSIKVAELGFDSELCNYLHKTKDIVKLNKIFTVSKEVYKSIQNLLKGRPDMTLVKGDKLFVLPSHPLTQEKLKDYLDTLGVKIVRDIADATVVAGNSYCLEETNSSEQIKTNKLGCLSQAMALVIDPGSNNDIVKGLTHRNDFNIDNAKKVAVDFTKGIECIVPDNSRPRYYTPCLSSSNNEKAMLFPLTMEIIHTILSKRLRVITEDYLVDNMHSEMKITDESVCNSIIQMINSNDDKDVTVGIDLLTKCDLSGNSLYPLWRIAQEVGNKIVNFMPKPKALHHFMLRTNFNELRHWDEGDLAYNLLGAEELTKEIFQKLLPKIMEKEVVDGDFDKSHIFHGALDKVQSFFKLNKIGPYKFEIHLRKVWLKFVDDEA